MSTEPESNVLQFRKPEPGPRYEEAVERITELCGTMLSEGVTREDLFVAFGYHYVNMSAEMEATRGQLLDALLVILDDFEKMEI